MAIAVVLAALAPASQLVAQEQAPAPPADAATTAQPPAAGPATAAEPDATPPSVAPSTAAEVEQNQNALEEIEASITLSNERAAQLRSEIEQLDGDRARQSAELIAAAQRVKLAEIEIGAMEERLTSLVASEAEVRQRLDGVDSNISNLLAALERISANPPPALIVDPADALGSARSAILLAAIFPELRQRADAVAADMQQLADIKAAALEEEVQLRANHAILEEEQLRIATLIEARKRGMAVASAELEAEEAEAQALAARATSLKDLIETLSGQIEAVARAAEAAEAANAGVAPPELPAETVRLALANTERTAPAVPFSAARGHLARPANGTQVVDYGESDGFGGISQGLSLVTRAGAQVVAPADGWVMYKGDYLNYGQIVILNPGQDYTIVLAGLDDVSVDIGQFVLMGEPLGTMGSRTIGRTITTSAGGSEPTLYIEMRKQNVPLDPTGWWAAERTATQSG